MEMEQTKHYLRHEYKVNENDRWIFITRSEFDTGEFENICFNDCKRNMGWPYHNELKTLLSICQNYFFHVRITALNMSSFDCESCPGAKTTGTKTSVQQPSRQLYNICIKCRPHQSDEIGNCNRMMLEWVCIADDRFRWITVMKRYLKS